MKKHARFSPSSIERVMACPGSVKLSEGREKRTSAAADLGTQAHECLEMFLKNGIKQRWYTEAFLRESHPPEMVGHAFHAAGVLWATAGGLRVESEKKVLLPHIDPDLWGTLDAAIVEDFGLLEIIDFKYGKFIAVEAENNGQLLTYAVGLAREHHYNFSHVRLTILQPRAPHSQGTVRSWTVPLPYLFEWEEKLREAISAARAKKPKFSAGEHCFFCNAKSVCKAYTPEATTRVRAGFISESYARETPEQTKKRLRKVFGSPDDTPLGVDDQDNW